MPVKNIFQHIASTAFSKLKETQDASKILGLMPHVLPARVHRKMMQFMC